MPQTNDTKTAVILTRAVYTHIERLRDEVIPELLSGQMLKAADRAYDDAARDLMSIIDRLEEIERQERESTPASSNGTYYGDGDGGVSRSDSSREKFCAD